MGGPWGVYWVKFRLGKARRVMRVGLRGLASPRREDRGKSALCALCWSVSWASGASCSGAVSNFAIRTKL